MARPVVATFGQLQSRKPVTAIKNLLIKIGKIFRSSADTRSMFPLEHKQSIEEFQNKPEISEFQRKS